ncbi:MAG TPA: hypothetical protein VH595_19380 [Verrucomicrobiae bacterium]|jgi:hypothetical protein|nr:hypothetical protein [Verrucomicrobiae bacterium]
MKIQRLIKYAAATLVALAAVCTAPRSSAATTITNSYTNSFDTAGATADFSGSGSVVSWIYWYGIITNAAGQGNVPMTNDVTMDAEGQTNTSGSLSISLPFSTTGNQAVFFGTFDNAYGYDNTEVMPLNIVTQLAFDIHVAPGIKTNSSGNFGNITIALIDPTWQGGDFGFFTSITIPASATNGWVHMVDTNTVKDILNMESSSYTTAAGIGFNYNSYGGYPTNPITFWIDNVAVTTAAIPPPPPPPPTLTISHTVQGLNLFAGTGASLYNREDIETTSGNYSWVGASGPVSYSFTITNYPINAGDAFQTQIFLVPNPGTENDPDWTEPNLIFLDMESTGTGAQATFRYKTNEPNGNTMVYGVGGLATISAPSGVGTWTLTFNQNTNVTITVPGGGSTNFNIPDTTGATTALFQSDVALYFGVQAGNAGAANDHIVASDFSVTGLGSSDFNDNFVTDALTTGTLNTSIWETNAVFPVCVEFIGTGDPYWVTWSSPAIGYGLNVASNLLNPFWTEPTNHPSFLVGTNYTQLINTNDLPGTNAAFFSVIQRTFSQLQILLTGETAAPGTSTGETGTPTYSLSTNEFTTVTVNAVDASWFLIPGITDNVTISTSDQGAGFAGGSTGNLVNGTFQVEMAFGTAGPQTVTVVDNTNTNIPPATVTVDVTP